MHGEVLQERVDESKHYSQDGFDLTGFFDLYSPGSATILVRHPVSASAS
jgi:hypothetical protein